MKLNHPNIPLLKSMTELDLLLNDYGSVSEALAAWIKLNKFHIHELQLWKGILERIKENAKVMGK